MADEKIKAAETLSDDELENVAGGTFKQTMDLYNEIAKVNIGVAKKISNVSRIYQEQGYKDEQAFGYAMNDVLKEYNIRALPSEHANNSYEMLDGKPISAADVVNILSFEII